MLCQESGRNGPAESGCAPEHFPLFPIASWQATGIFLTFQRHFKRDIKRGFLKRKMKVNLITIPASRSSHFERQMAKCRVGHAGHLQTAACTVISSLCHTCGAHWGALYSAPCTLLCHHSSSSFGLLRPWLILFSLRKQTCPDLRRVLKLHACIFLVMWCAIYF